MVKEMRFDWKYPWNLHKLNHFVVKFAVSILLMGAAFRLFFSQSTTFSPVIESPFGERTAAAETHVPDLALQREARKGLQFKIFLSWGFEEIHKEETQMQKDWRRLDFVIF